jgi:hypothetical protein
LELHQQSDIFRQMDSMMVILDCPTDSQYAGPFGKAGKRNAPQI